MEKIGDEDVQRSKRKSIPSDESDEDFITDDNPITKNGGKKEKWTEPKDNVDEADKDPTKDDKATKTKEYNRKYYESKKSFLKIKQTNIQAVIFLPQSRFLNLTYSPSNTHLCEGTLAFECRATKEPNYQSLCHTCKGDWIGIRAGTLKKQWANIKWRYGEQIGINIIVNNRSPINYYRFVQEEKVHRFHYQQIKCPTCPLHLPFLTLNHQCNNPHGSDEKNSIPFLDSSSYTNTHVILTFARTSGFVTIRDLEFKQSLMYSRSAETIKNNYPLDTIIHGQRYMKKGHCASTVIHSSWAQTGFRSYQYIAQDIIQKFSTAKHIWLIMKEPGCFCCSPYYIAEFLNQIPAELLPKISFVILRWFDRGKIEVKEEIGLHAPDILKLCQPDTLCAVPYFTNENRDIILEGVDDQIRTTWKYFESMLILQQEREMKCHNDRNDPIE